MFKLLPALHFLFIVFLIKLVVLVLSKQCSLVEFKKHIVTPRLGSGNRRKIIKYLTCINQLGKIQKQKIFHAERPSLVFWS